MKTRYYRVTFGRNVECNYWEKKGVKGLTFEEVYDYYYCIIKIIRDKAKRIGIKEIWHFFEPFMEITWLATPEQNAKIKKEIRNVCNRFHLHKDLKFESGWPGKGFGPDWFCNNEVEREFGGKRHAVCAELISLFWDYREPIEEGLGKREQISRCIHTLCNPLGMNYREEAKICFSRGLMCWMYWYLPPKIAKWIYVKVFRQKLPK